MPVNEVANGHSNFILFYIHTYNVGCHSQQRLIRGAPSVIGPSAIGPNAIGPIVIGLSAIGPVQ